MSTIISYERTDEGIKLYFESSHGRISVPLSHEERRELGFFLLEVAD